MTFVCVCWRKSADSSYMTAEHAAEQRARPNRLIESAVRPETASRIVLLCPKELAAQTGLSYRTILNHIRLGHLPAWRAMFTSFRA
jgi:hypothetical protein